jgi:hypothetical protein
MKTESITMLTLKGLIILFTENTYRNEKSNINMLHGHSSLVFKSRELESLC